jgi:hypothetical protein
MKKKKEEETTTNKNKKKRNAVAEVDWSCYRESQTRHNSLSLKFNLQFFRCVSTKHVKAKATKSSRTSFPYVFPPSLPSNQLSESIASSECTVTSSERG